MLTKGAYINIQRLARADNRVRDTSSRHFYSVAASIFLKKKHESIRGI